MFKIESYISPVLLSYVDKYVQNFNPADAQVTIWGGGILLHNLVLKADVLQQELALPFTLVSGRINELFIQVPWTKIMSEPIVATIDTIECVLSLNPPPTPPEETPRQEIPSNEMLEAPPGYMQALIRRIVSNVSLRISHLIVKYVQDDIVMSLNVKNMNVDSCGADWVPAFADIESKVPIVRRVVRIEDLTLCLDKSDADGKIHFYQEPILYRCQLELRILTNLISANSRRVNGLGIQLRSSKLDWSVTTDQLVLLLRLVKELDTHNIKIPPPTANASTTDQAPDQASSSNTAEPARYLSWSEWAWSWMPSWNDKDEETEEAVPFTGPTPISFSAYVDEMSLVFKVMESDGNNRKRARVILEINALHAALRCYFKLPTLLLIKLGLRTITMRSLGKCICGHGDVKSNQEPTTYLEKIETPDTEQQWEWPEEEMVDIIGDTDDDNAQKNVLGGQRKKRQKSDSPESYQFDIDQSVPSQFEDTHSQDYPQFWRKMAPVVLIDYIHERSPPTYYADPCDDHPPVDFEHSDWVENSNLKIKVEAVLLTVSMGLVHRMTALLSILKDIPRAPTQELPMRVLTVEESEALYDNLPQRHLMTVIKGLQVRILPWDHSLTEKPTPLPLYLEINFTKIVVLMNMPMYSHRVCSAACQLPDDAGPVWRGAQLNLTVIILDAQAGLCSLTNPQPKICIRSDFRFVLHRLLNEYLFVKRESVIHSYSMKIRELNIFGSAARIRASWEIMMSLLNDRESMPLRNTMLAMEAINDEDAAAIDLSFEEVSLRCFISKNVNTFLFSLHSARGMILHDPKGGHMKQAWIFSAPDVLSTSPYIRTTIQWCNELMQTAPDYIGTWMQATAFSGDPLLLAWLAYKPKMKPVDSQNLPGTSGSSSSSQIFTRPQETQPSSLRGVVRSQSGTELIHGRTRSAGSSGEPSEKKEMKLPLPSTSGTPTEPPVVEWWAGQKVRDLYERLRNALVTIDVGIVIVYFTTSTVSALDSGGLRDAMERHVTKSQRVLVISLGRMALDSSPILKPDWTEICNDGPTITAPRPVLRPEEPDAFPWKMRITDVSCYTLELRAGSSRWDNSTSRFRSQLRMPCVVCPKTILELVSTSVTIAIVTKTLTVRVSPPTEATKNTDESPQGTKLRYYAGGIDYKPNTMEEFLQGPASDQNSPASEQTEQAGPSQAPAYVNTTVESVGMNMYADTCPVIIRLEHDQVHLIAAAVHYFRHIVPLVQRPPSVPSQETPRKPKPSTESSPNSLTRSASEMDGTQSASDSTSTSDTKSELTPISEAPAVPDATLNMKTFFWFQWVVGRVSLELSTENARIAFELEDIISTVDLHRYYSQIKSKVGFASVRHFEKRGRENWVASAPCGRVMEVREPINVQEPNIFFTITITQAQLSKLPKCWREELHPKLLENKNNVDEMWEIFVSLAPLEMILRPRVIQHFLSFAREMLPRSSCLLQETQLQTRPKATLWPFLFLDAGGVRLFVTCQKEDRVLDDTLVLEIGKITGNPYPANPIYRSPLISPVHPHWTGNTKDQEGRQYEFNVGQVTIRTTQFRQIVFKETSDAEIRQGRGGEIPALRWNLPDTSPVITSVLHPLDTICIFAPTVYVSGTVLCGPVVEFTMTPDCLIEFTPDQLILIHQFSRDMADIFTSSDGSGSLFGDENQRACPYAKLLKKDDSVKPAITSNDNPCIAGSSQNPQYMASGTDDASAENFAFPTSTKPHEQKPSSSQTSAKKSISIDLADQTVEPVKNLELFVNFGAVDISLYTFDDNSPETKALRPPKIHLTRYPKPNAQVLVEEASEPSLSDDTVTHTSNRSISESARKAGRGKAKLQLPQIQESRRRARSIALVQVILNDANFYYCRKKDETLFQVSIFNLWAGLGMRQFEGTYWHVPLIITTRGAPDPETEIPPTLFTMKVALPTANVNAPNVSATNVIPKGGSISCELERPVVFKVSADRFRRLKTIYGLIKKKMRRSELNYREVGVRTNAPWIYKIKNILKNNGIESVTLQTNQIGLSGSEGTVGWDGVTLQVAIGSKPDRLVTFGSVVALVMSIGSPDRKRHVFLQPLMLGFSADARWEVWQSVEDSSPTLEPTLLLNIEIESVTIDPRPEDLITVRRIQDVFLELINGNEPPTGPGSSAETLNVGYNRHYRPNVANQQPGTSSNNSFNSDSGDAHYKDDLRSGAFKIMHGAQLPIPYEAMLYENCITWKYPHPRSISYINLLPIPGQNDEVECVLEFYDAILGKWETHTYFNLPVGEPKGTLLTSKPPEAVFASLWRFRACYGPQNVEPPFEYDIAKFLPRHQPLMEHPVPGPPEGPKGYYSVTATQIIGILRVDSYFTPRLLPRTRLVGRLSLFEVNLHNSLPILPGEPTALDGYYVSRSLTRSHRVLCIRARDNTVHAQMNSPAGTLFLLDTRISSDILESSTGTMELFVDKIHTHLALSFPDNMLEKACSRVCIKKVRIAIHVPRLRTLQTLMEDWTTAVDLYKRKPTQPNRASKIINRKCKREVAAATATALEGRITLWIHNDTASPLRFGQEGTSEVLLLAPGITFAYRWHKPDAPKRLHFAFNGSVDDWFWSKSVPFISGERYVALEDSETQIGENTSPGSRVLIHTKTVDIGAQRNMYLSGRLVLSNMLHHDLMYKVQYRKTPADPWENISSGQLPSEIVGKSILCSADCQLMLKLKFPGSNAGWTGDIPLKESPLPHIPWLVKVPLNGPMPYLSTWCRVAQVQNGRRLIVTLWPLYLIQSHLPLDVKVFIHTHSGLSYVDLSDPAVINEPLPQLALGRGTTTQLNVPGTTTARHNLTFQYKNANTLITCEPVPLNYNVTERSVFQRQKPIATVEDIIKQIKEWLQKFGKNAKSPWPYSIVTNHFHGNWIESSYQPETDTIVRYQPVRDAGGCCVNIQVTPILLICNATPLTFTLRAYNVAPLYTVDSGIVIAPPSIVIRRPFYLSLDERREVYLSEQLQLLVRDPSPYYVPPPGLLLLDRPTNIVIKCNTKVILLTLFYEVKTEINVVGISVTHTFLNRLNTNILISTFAVPIEKENNYDIRLGSFKMVGPTKQGRFDGTSLTHFWMRDEWHGTKQNQLRTYLCLALPAGRYPAFKPVPIRLGTGPSRRSVALVDKNNKSVPVVVIQFKHHGRWLVAVCEDPCPQYIVYNRTRVPYIVAEPSDISNDPSTAIVNATQECAGANWWCVAYPRSSIHYSSPSYSARYPREGNATASNYVPFLVFAIAREGWGMEWCQPIEVTDGEKLILLPGGTTIKITMRVHPHSSYIELRDINQNDMSANDIRKRLHGGYNNDAAKFKKNLKENSFARLMERSVAEAEMVDHSCLDMERKSNCSAEASGMSFIPSFPPVIPPGGTPHTPPPEIPGPSYYNPYAHGRNATLPEVPAAEFSYGEHTHNAQRGTSEEEEEIIQNDLDNLDVASPEPSCVFSSDICNHEEWNEDGVTPVANERLRFIILGASIEMSAAYDVDPIVAVHVDNVAGAVFSESKKTKAVISVAQAQVDNNLFSTRLYDFAVLAKTADMPLNRGPWSPIWTMFQDYKIFAIKQSQANLLLSVQYDKWSVLGENFRELTEISLHVGPTSLYIEDAYLKTLKDLFRMAFPQSDSSSEELAEAEEWSLVNPLRLRRLYISPMNLTLTLHTAVRMYIALDHSPLSLSAFKVENIITMPENLTHMLTVHYLSSAIFGAGWVVGGLELLGAPGAIAARVSNATGGIRGVATATAAALVHSVSCWAGSMARNLDLLAGDEEYARRAAEARRQPPETFGEGLMTGITNFAINMLGAVGGLAHHPFVGVSVGESESSATALRRGLIGALTKPLSATADLVAFAGQGLLKQTGWDNKPECRVIRWSREAQSEPGWRRDNVRWAFRLIELAPIVGFQVDVKNTKVELLITHKLLLIADMATDRILEIIDLRQCKLAPYHSPIVELLVLEKYPVRVIDTRVDENGEYQVSATAMARVAFYTGAATTSCIEIGHRRFSLLPPPGRSFTLQAALAATMHYNADSHFALL